jgi:hypothetical protein
MLEKLGFQSLVEQTVSSERIPRAMDLYRFALGLYIGFPQLNQLRFSARAPGTDGILKAAKLPVRSTFWRFIDALHLNVARQILAITRTMRERVWAAANVNLEAVTLDADATVHTLYGQQMGGRKSYNPKNKGKKSYQPMLICRDAGIYLGRTAQRRSSQWQTDRRSYTECVCGPAAGRGADLRPGGFGVLLPGSGRGL